MDLSSELSPKRIRKGTKSCLECRQRKIRCVYEAETDQVCIGCKTRQRPCVPQVFRRGTNNADSRDRLRKLERQIASIAAAVQQKGHVGPDCTPTSSPGANVSAIVEDVADDYHMEGPASTPPTYLRLLFDSIAPRNQQAESEHVQQLPCSRKHLDHARAQLQHLMPSKEDVRSVASHGTAWMSLYRSLFASALQFGSSDAMIDRYDEQLKSDAQPVDIASFLLAFAITVRNVPPNEQKLTLRDVTKYVSSVLHTVEATIVSVNDIVSTVKGLSTAILYLRLQLGVGQIKHLWLTLRRVVAIAELIGLPRAWNRNHFESRDQQRTGVRQMICEAQLTEQVALWEAICATDRLASMMFNLPAATATHIFPRRQIVTSEGKYLLELAGIAMSVQELDETFILKQANSDVYQRVLAIDNDIRSLRSLTPIHWWTDEAVEFSGDHLVQFWHFYLLVRTHVHFAMSSDDHDQYAYSHRVCAEACHSLARRYRSIRRQLPQAFFVCRIIDMQIFTAAVFLILSSYGQTGGPNGNTTFPAMPHDERQLTSIRYILTTLESVSEQVGSEFAREAIDAIKSLMSLLGNPAAANAQGLTLRIPLLGKIHIAAEQQTSPPPQQVNSDHPQLFSHRSATASIPPTNATAVNDLPEALPWLMELDMNSSSLQDPFVTNEFGDWTHWVPTEDMSYMT